MLRKKGLLRFGISLLIPALILVWVFRTVSFSEVIKIIADADRYAVLCFVVLSLSTSVFRMLRYRLLLRMAGQAAPAPALFLIVLVRNLFSDLLPARIGSLIYIYLLNSRLGIAISSASSSFALAFLFDTMAIAPIALFAAATGSTGGISPASLMIAAFTALAGSATLIHLLPHFGAWAHAWLKNGKSQGARREKVIRLLTEIQRDLAAVKHAGIYSRLFALSIAVRLGKYLTLYAFLLALLLPRGYEIGQLSFARVFPGLCASELAASLPVSGIAGFGAYQGAWVLSFSLLGWPLELAKLTSVAHHLFTQAWGYSLGALAFLLLILMPAIRSKKVSSN